MTETQQNETDHPANQSKFIRDGFQKIPDELYGVDHVTVVCGTSMDPHVGCGWTGTYDVDPEEIVLKGNGTMTLPDIIPRPCPECGERMHFQYNGVEVSFDV